MTDTKTVATMPTNASVQSPKKEKSPAKTKKPRAKPTHPRTADMVNSAIKALQERGGSSLQAIKKYMITTYKIDAEKHAPFIKRYLKSAVSNGNLVQTKGKGAAGSFKLSVSKSEASKTKKRTGSLKSPPLKKIPSRPIAKKVIKKTVKKPGKKLPIKTATKKSTKGPAAKPPKAKTAAKVKVTARPVKTQKKAGKVGKAKKQVKKNIARKK